MLTSIWQRQTLRRYTYDAAAMQDVRTYTDCVSTSGKGLDNCARMLTLERWEDESDLGLRTRIVSRVRSLVNNPITPARYVLEGLSNIIGMSASEGMFDHQVADMIDARCDSLLRIWKVA